MEQAMRDSSSSAAAQPRTDNDPAAAPDFSQAGSVTFTAEDFPAVSGRGLGNVAGGRWASAAAPSLRSGGRGGVDEEDFPALPTMSKSAKRRLKEKKGNTLHARLVAAAAPARVIHRASSASGLAAASSNAHPSHVDPAGAAAADGFVPVAGGPRGSRPATAATNSNTSEWAGGAFSALGISEQLGPGSAASQQQAQQAPAAAPQPAAQPDFPALASSSRAAEPPAGRTMVDRLKAGTTHGWLQPSSNLGSSDLLAQEDAFPALPTSAAPPKRKSLVKKKAAPAPAPITADSGGANMSRLLQQGGTKPGSSGDLPTFGFSTDVGPSLGTQDFPSLATKPSSKRNASKASGSKEAAAPAAGAGISEGVKAANKALVQQIKQQLDADAFAAFKQQSGSFMQGQTSARVYHDQIVKLGLLPLAAEMAALCPDEHKRSELLAAHR